VHVVCVLCVCTVCVLCVALLHNSSKTVLDTLFVLGPFLGLFRTHTLCAWALLALFWTCCSCAWARFASVGTLRTKSA